MLVGNDVVDLGAAAAGDKANDCRFVARVFRSEERRLIDESPDPTLALWRLWAAKEAAYKIARKLDPSLVFAHRDFVVDPSGRTVRFGRLQVAITWERGDGYVHATGLAAREKSQATVVGALLSRVARLGEASTLGEPLSPAELASCHSPESGAVRALAKGILRECGLAGAEIVRPPGDAGDGASSRPGPPVARLSGEPIPGLDLSLSHDGRFLAAAVYGPIRRPFPGGPASAGQERAKREPGERGPVHGGDRRGRRDGPPLAGSRAALLAEHHPPPAGARRRGRLT